MEEVIYIENTPAQKDYRRSELALLVCNTEHIPKQLIYTRPYEDDETMDFNPIDVLKEHYAPLSKILMSEEHVYLGLCSNNNFHPYVKII